MYYIVVYNIHSNKKNSPLFALQIILHIPITINTYNALLFKTLAPIVGIFAPFLIGLDYHCLSTIFHITKHRLILGLVLHLSSYPTINLTCFPNYAFASLWENSCNVHSIVLIQFHVWYTPISPCNFFLNFILLWMLPKLIGVLSNQA